MYPICFSTAFGNRRNAGVLRDIQGGMEAAPVGSHRCKQAGRQNRNGTGKAAEYLSIRMFLENFLGSLVKFRDCMNEQT